VKLFVVKFLEMPCPGPGARGRSSAPRCTTALQKRSGLGGTRCGPFTVRGSRCTPSRFTRNRPCG